MQLKSLRIFREVARTRSFVAAAELLHTVQSNVTAHIKKLEEELDVKLIDRHGSVRLTSAGRALIQYAESILSAHDEALSVFEKNASPRGCIRIGAMETTTALRLPPILAQFHETHPEIDITLQTGPTADLIKGMQEGEHDCIFVAGKVNHPRLHHMKVFDEQLVLVSAQPMDEMPTPQTLQTATFLAFRQGCSYRQRIELLMAHYEIYATRIFEFGTLDAILGCVAAGMGYAILPRMTLETHQHRFKVYSHPLPEAIGQVATYFTAPETSLWTPALTAFAKTLREPLVQKGLCRITELNT
ncbi:LysR family transcriptional regulator [Terasakiispira papahanaumokuakeensis]|uniref:LysR family transcriptional regulator n=1 Tax=Terasakiispira papahanaumokuakeensis TaxID=197479 RepID=A0A1E2V864_9GAMM|nr:LysR family transcriptional regulator [Terasakiispira papahanaumokuakeensis]ODC02845.1 LysR family transcriptional regulator [Terasakiispira papahanaumokuakeensis]